LDLARQHQKGSVAENATLVAFDFTEGWFRASGLYDLCEKYQLLFMQQFIADKFRWQVKNAWWKYCHRAKQAKPVVEMLPPPKQEKAKELRQQGWTQERIGAVLGVPQRTISDWLKQFSDFAKLPPETSTITGADGKQYPASRYTRRSIRRRGLGNSAVLRMVASQTKIISLASHTFA